MPSIAQIPPSVQSQTPREVYEQRVAEGRLNNDGAQKFVIGKLQALFEAVSEPTRRGFLRSLISSPKETDARSIYLWGAVGRGKSLLMDMFFDTLTITKKRRIHFHAFMQEVHAATHKLRQEIQAKQFKIELLPAIAHDIARDVRVLCLDELQVTDVADAMILSKLFTSLLAEGVTVVITSNRPPEELYLGGLQRETFLEFVHLLCTRMDVLQLNSPYDYRMQQIKAMQATYMSPLSEGANKAFDETLAELSHHSELVPMNLDVRGHQLQIPKSYGGIACFQFADLCEKPLGAADYLVIAKRFHTVFIKAIPKLGPEKRNEARRFVTLVDTLYDHRVKLICTAEVPPAELYPSGDGSFEFQRLVSRLSEMQSQQYLTIPHLM